jgi:precorrin-2 methylase
MATNIELNGFLTDDTIITRVTIACLKKADIVYKNVGSTQGQKNWADGVISQVIPRGLGVRVLTQLLLDNENSSASAIQTVLGSDSQTQTRVNNFLDNIISSL